MFRFTSTLFRIKSECHARFSALQGSQLCERMIQSMTSCGAQPFPKQNNISLNVSLLLIGLAQNILWYSCGHAFKGKNASPLMVLNNFLHSVITFLLVKQTELATILIQVCHIHEFLTSVYIFHFKQYWRLLHTTRMFYYVLITMWLLKIVFSR